MIQKISRLSIVALLLLLNLSCTQETTKEDTVTAVSKNGAVETTVSVEHADSADVLITRHKVWVKNNLVKEVTTRDTIPALGDTILPVTSNGNEIQQKARKDYEFYITVQ